MTFRPGGTKDEVYYSEMPVDIVVRGRYHQVGSFLAELANMQRIVTVSNMKLEAAPGNDVGATTTASFGASAYSLTNSPARPVTPAPSAPKPAANNKKGEGSNAHPES